MHDKGDDITSSSSRVNRVSTLDIAVDLAEGCIQKKTHNIMASFATSSSMWCPREDMGRACSQASDFFVEVVRKCTRTDAVE